MAGKFRINGQTITQKQDGTWLGPDGNKMSNESVYRIFGNKTIKQDSKTGKLNFDWDQYNNRTSEEKRRQTDHEMEFSDGAYDAKGNPRTRDYKKQPRTKYDNVEDEMGGMMDEFRGKGFWQPSPLFVPPVEAFQSKFGRPRWEDVQNAQLDRGPDFTQEHQEGKVYNTPIDQMSPPAYQPDRRQPSYNGESSGLRQLSSQEIDQMNSQRNPPVRMELERMVPRRQVRTIWDHLRSLKRNVQ
jgi:hypothetical protein